MTSETMFWIFLIALLLFVFFGGFKVTIRWPEEEQEQTGTDPWDQLTEEERTHLKRYFR